MNSHPALCTTYEGNNPALLERVLPLIDYLEVTPDSIASLNDDKAVLQQQAVNELKRISSQVKIIAHGVGLSIGSHDGYSQRYIRLLDDLVAQINVEWHSEHLGYTMVDGENLGTMLALPRTNDVLNMICARIQVIQDRYKKPFLLENIVHLLPDYETEYSDAMFLNAITKRTGCGLILDAYNLECDAHNYGFDIAKFLDELELENVWEMHVAGGVEHQGIFLDIHSRLTATSTIALARDILARTSAVKVITYELLAEAVSTLGYDQIVNELIRLRQLLLN